MDANAHADSSNEGHATRYVLVWVALMVLTATTYGVSRIDLGAFNLPASLLIATIKATLVALIFMHLWQHRGSMRIVLFVSICFVALLATLTLLDYATRWGPTIPPGAARSPLPVNAETVDTPSEGQPGR